MHFVFRAQVQYVTLPSTDVGAMRSQHLEFGHQTKRGQVP